jgi:hypothetical protein
MRWGRPSPPPWWKVQLACFLGSNGQKLTLDVVASLRDENPADLPVVTCSSVHGGQLLIGLRPVRRSALAQQLQPGGERKADRQIGVGQPIKR